MRAVPAPSRHLCRALNKVHGPSSRPRPISVRQVAARKRFNVDVVVTEIRPHAAARTGRPGVCTRSLRRAEWAARPQGTSLTLVPPPYDMGPDETSFPARSDELKGYKRRSLRTAFLFVSSIFPYCGGGSGILLSVSTFPSPYAVGRVPPWHWRERIAELATGSAPRAWVAHHRASVLQ